MEKLVVLVLLTALLYDVSSAQNKMAYFKIGGELTLKPVFPDAIKNILWKLNGDLVAEWVKDAVPLVVYDRFKNRTTLDLSTGHLTMKNMSQKDEGEFSYEFNDKIQAVRYTGKAIKEVPKPIVNTKPLACESHLDECGLSCYGDTKEAGPVTYSWKEGDGEWQEQGSDITIIKIDSFFFETVSCMMKNPVSEKKSDPINNPENNFNMISIACLKPVSNCQSFWDNLCKE
uniref:SLAM family member 7-like n=1 Tax=Labrus bergylta TaxID=56723 RepID=A0A3Q3E3W0_9LABR